MGPSAWWGPPAGRSGKPGDPAPDRWPLLQPGQGPIVGHYLPSTPQTVSWGWIRPAGSTPALTVAPGAVVTVDTISHEGLLGDQGRDPVAWFAGHGVPAEAVLSDAVALAASPISHDQRRDGPHVVTGPIAVTGAEPGDLVTVEVLSLTMRAPYGVVSNRHGRGALAGELPEAIGPGLTVPPVVSRFASVTEAGPFGSVSTAGSPGGGPAGPPGAASRGEPLAWLQGPELALPVPLRPHLGLVAVAPPQHAAHSVPPGPHGGNLDVRLLGVGSRLHLPVLAPGALVQIGDPHLAQGDGEVALTAVEGPLRAVLRLWVTKGAAPPWGLPVGETPGEWIVLGLHEDLDEAVRVATRAALQLVRTRTGADPATAYAWLSAAGDLGVSQVVDGVKGVHFVLPKRWLDAAVRHPSP